MEVYTSTGAGDPIEQTTPESRNSPGRRWGWEALECPGLPASATVHASSGRVSLSHSGSGTRQVPQECPEVSLISSLCASASPLLAYSLERG
jgi:hypothetical protein